MIAPGTPFEVGKSRIRNLVVRVKGDLALIRPDYAGSHAIWWPLADVARRLQHRVSAPCQDEGGLPGWEER